MVPSVPKKLPEKKKERKSKAKKKQLSPDSNWGLSQVAMAPSALSGNGIRIDANEQERTIHGSLQMCYRCTTELLELHTGKLAHRVRLAGAILPSAFQQLFGRKTNPCILAPP